jgi:hypothetical protein
LIHNGFEILDEDCKWYFENNWNYDILFFNFLK